MHLSNVIPDLWGISALVVLWLLCGVVTGDWRPWAVVDGADGRPSTSKLQFFLWTVVVLFAYVAFYAARVHAGHYEAIDQVAQNLLIAMGLSLTTMTVAKGITVGYMTSGRVAKTPPAPHKEVGLAAVILDDGNNPDLSKIQMLAWTAIAIAVYLISLHRAIFLLLGTTNPSAAELALPDIDTTLMVLMGLGHGAYVGKKLTMTTISRLTGISPSSGPPGTAATVYGTCLGDSPDGNAVTIDGFPIPYVPPPGFVAPPPAVIGAGAVGGAPPGGGPAAAPGAGAAPGAPTANSPWQDTRVMFVLPARHPSGVDWLPGGQVIAVGVTSGGQDPANTLSFTVTPPQPVHVVQPVQPAQAAPPAPAPAAPEVPIQPVRPQT